PVLHPEATAGDRIRRISDPHERPLEPGEARIDVGAALLESRFALPDHLLRLDTGANGEDHHDRDPGTRQHHRVPSTIASSRSCARAYIGALSSAASTWRLAIAACPVPR